MLGGKVSTQGGRAQRTCRRWRYLSYAFKACYSGLPPAPSPHPSQPPPRAPPARRGLEHQQRQAQPGSSQGAGSRMRRWSPLCLTCPNPLRLYQPTTPAFRSPICVPVLPCVSSPFLLCQHGVLTPTYSAAKLPCYSPLTFHCTFVPPAIAAGPHLPLHHVIQAAAEWVRFGRQGRC